MAVIKNLFEEETKVSSGVIPNLFDGKEKAPEGVIPDLFAEKPAPAGARMPFVPGEKEPTTVGKPIDYAGKVFEPKPKLTIEQAKLLRGKVERVESRIGYLPEEEKKAIFSDVFTELPKVEYEPITPLTDITQATKEFVREARPTEEQLKHPIKTIFQAGTRYPRALFSGLEALQTGTSPVEAVKKGWLPEIAPDEKVRSSTEIAWDMADRMYAYGKPSTSTAWNFLKYLPYTTAGTLAEFRLNPAVFLTFQGLNKVLTNPFVAKFMAKDMPAPAWFDNALKGAVKGFYRPFEGLAKNVKESRINAITDELYKKFEPRMGELKDAYRKAYRAEPTINDIKGLIKKELVIRGIYEKPLIELQKILLRGRKIASLKPKAEARVKPEPTRPPAPGVKPLAVKPEVAPKAPVIPPTIPGKPPVVPVEAPVAPKAIPEVVPSIEGAKQRIRGDLNKSGIPIEFVNAQIKEGKSHKQIMEWISGLKDLESDEVLTTGFSEQLKAIIETKETLDFAQAKPTPEVPAPVKPELQPLAEEAKKFKTAEEFVKKQKIYYTGGKKEITEFKPELLTKLGEKRIGIYLTSDKKYAQVFAGKEGKITEAITTFKKPFQIKDEQNDLLIEAPQSFSKYIQELKDKGYDAIVSSDKRQILVLDTKKVFTKSQLTAIWQQAQVKPTAPAPVVETLEQKMLKELREKPATLKSILERPRAWSAQWIDAAEKVKAEQALKGVRVEKPVKEVPAPKGKITVLPRKQQLLTQIKEAIKKAPDITIRDFSPEALAEAEIGKVTFEIDGGANIINTKKILMDFYNKISRTAPTTPSIQPIKKRAVRKLTPKELAEVKITKAEYEKAIKKPIIEPKGKNIPEKIISLPTDQTAMNIPNISLETEEMTGAMLLYDSLRPHFQKHIESFAGKVRFIAPESQNELKKLLNKNLEYYLRKFRSIEEKTGAEKAYIYLKEQFNKILIEQVKPVPEITKPAPGAAAGAMVAPSAAQAGKGYGIIEPSEKAAKVKPTKTDRAKVAENMPLPIETSYIKEAFKIVAPASVSEVAQISSQIMRKGLAELAHKDVMAIEAMKKAHTSFTWMSKEDTFKFIDDLEQGLPQDNPKLQPFADTMRKLLDERRATVQNLGKGQLESFYENYFPHIWKDPKKSKNIIASILGRKRLAGTKAFLKKRTIMTIKEGIAAGLEPVSDNPVDIVSLKLHEIDRYVMAQNVIQELKGKGLIKFVYSRSQAPDGYTRINDSAFTVYMPPEITKKEAYDSVLVDQLMDIAKSLGIDVKRFMSIGGRRWGWARDVGEGQVRTKFAGPATVLTHEIGHVLGYNFGLYDAFRKYKDTYVHTFKKGRQKGETIVKPTKEAVEWRVNIDKQWRALADARYKGIEATPGYKSYVRKSREKEAVLLEALIHAPDEFKSFAPDIHKLFTKFLNEHGQLRPLLDVKPSLVLGESEGKIKIPGFTTLGHYYAPKDAALIVNNHLSPGLRNAENKLIGTSYNMLRGTGNILNQVNLSLSAFHALNVTTDMMASTVGLGLRRLTIKGQRLKGIADIALFPIAPVTAVWEGTRIKKAYRRQMDSIQDPKMKAMLEALMRGGGRDRMDVFYYNQQLKALQKTFRDILKGTGIEKASGVVRLPFNIFGSTLEVLAKPLMQWFVPTGKIGLFSKLVKSEMQRAEVGEINDEQLTYMFTKIWDSVDNRMGQLIYDNLFWNKVLKDSLMIAIRSVGWNLGSWREYAGSVVDLLTAYSRVKKGDKIFSHKMAYATGAAIVYAIAGAIITYMLTGERPRELKDYFFPRTGKKNPDGSDERLSLPTYAKDIYAYGTRPIETLRSKRHPLIGLSIEQFANKDFFSVQISDFKDPILDQIYDRGKHIVNYSKPFSFKNYERMQLVSDDPALNLGVSITGIVTAPSYLTRSPAQKLMYRYIAERMPTVSRTEEDFEKSRYRKTLKDRIRKGEVIDAKEAKQILGVKGYVRLRRDARLPPFAESFKRLSLNEALEVYSIATNKERAEVRQLLRKKYFNAGNKSDDVKDLYKELIK